MALSCGWRTYPGPWGMAVVTRPGVCHPSKGCLYRFCSRLGPQNLKAAVEVADTDDVLCTAVEVCQSKHATHPRPVFISMTMSECPKGEYMESIPLGCHHSAL